MEEKHTIVTQSEQLKNNVKELRQNKQEKQHKKKKWSYIFTAICIIGLVYEVSTFERFWLEIFWFVGLIYGAYLCFK